MLGVNRKSITLMQQKRIVMLNFTNLCLSIMVKELSLFV